MAVRSVGIVGYGHFGAFLVQLAHRFTPDVEVRVYSRRKEVDGRLFFSLEEVARCDVVVLCGSIADFKKQLLSILPFLGTDSVVVDVATVKKHTSDLCKQYLQGKQWVSCHPMFGPESYQKTDGDVGGYRVVIADSTLRTHAQASIAAKLQELGFIVLEMTADEHDRFLAETLFITHLVGQTMIQAGFSRTAVDTVSFSSLMNAVESVAADTQLFSDVYEYNPYCQNILKRYMAAQQAVVKKVTGGKD